jgi:CheY-specific phosphatase CheX
MKSAISEVLETMFFTIVDFDGISASDQSYYCDTGIELAGEAQKIVIVFRVNAGFAAMTTAGFLGMAEEQIEADEIEDTMKEMANMVGGNFLSRLKEKSWRLGIPSFRLLESDEARERSGSAELPLYLFGEPVGVVTIGCEE